MASASAAAVSVGVGKAAGRTVEGHQFKGHFLRDGHHYLLELGLGSQAHEPDFAAGQVLGQVCRFKKAWPAHGSSTAGSIISFFNAGPAADATGSSVCSGSGTMLPQTTIWYDVFIKSLLRLSRQAGIGIRRTFGRHLLFRRILHAHHSARLRQPAVPLFIRASDHH